MQAHRRRRVLLATLGVGMAVSVGSWLAHSLSAQDLQQPLPRGQLGQAFTGRCNVLSVDLEEDAVAVTFTTAAEAVRGVWVLSFVGAQKSPNVYTRPLGFTVTRGGTLKYHFPVDKSSGDYFWLELYEQQNETDTWMVCVGSILVVRPSELGPASQ
jgi:hypothetical protein